ncbi:MAG: efflux RND transporter periplasmic adaptor subunit [Rhodocyclaceae bacterium]|nr:efflux RND transporter periplasmic adaptor subunit [Rhodocyclaceae bacterium]
MTHTTLKVRWIAMATVAACVLAACGQQKGSGAAGKPGAPGAGAQQMTVSVVTVKLQDVPLVTELQGRTKPHLVAEVRPQVTGIVQKRLFEEGAQVKAGQVLYQIDPSSYQATYDSAQAKLAKAKAQLTSAKSTAKRYENLGEIAAVSQQQREDAQSALLLAQAEQKAAEAAVRSARIDLDYTRVKSPISGRAGRSSVTQGALVTGNQAGVLVTVQQLDPIYVDVTQSSAQMLRLRQDFVSGKLGKVEETAVPVTILLEDGSEYAEQGRLEFAEVSVDENTGSVTMRVVVPNPQYELLPGMFVRARLEQGVRHNAALVPHLGVMRNQQGQAMVTLVNAQNKVEQRVVETEQSIGDYWVVTSGLNEGDRVIVEGLQWVRPGADVQATEFGDAPQPSMDGMSGMAGMSEMADMPTMAPEEAAPPPAADEAADEAAASAPEPASSEAKE